MFCLEMHYNGHFDPVPEMHYVGGEKVFFNNLDPNYLSLIELREMAKLVNLPINMPIRSKVPGSEYRLVNDNTIVLEMFGMYRDEPHIILYVGDVLIVGPQTNFWGLGDAENPGNVNAGNENMVGENSGNGNAEIQNHVGENPGDVNIENENPFGENIPEDRLSESSDSSYDGDGESEESTNHGSNLEYFIDGDLISDACDPIKKGFGQDAEVVPNSSDEENDPEFLAFNQETDMENPEMVVGLIFSSVDLYRCAIRMYSIRKGFQLRCPWSWKNRSANSKWLSTKLVAQIADNLDWGIRGIRKKVKKKFKLLVEICKPTEPRSMPLKLFKFCVRHLYANFKLKFKDKKLRDILWAAARAYLPSQWERKMNELKAVDQEAHKWLSAIPEKREWISKVKGNICPRIQEKLEANKDKSVEFEALKASEDLWDVNAFSNQNFVVNLSNKTCICREWDMTGIPCAHACASLISGGKEAEDYVHAYYNVESYKTAYKDIIMPIPEHIHWVSASGYKTDPPIIRKKPGRPKKVRKKGADEAPQF
ncbi:hypothetical protein ACH5RR_006642 [Cinchona calisaya]|uniref:SWIM-type domain-containing protein n=1 Tax=Cinchona calisaya TaxID=153742 RepID=A0ABD3APV7_9GENT